MTVSAFPAISDALLAIFHAAFDGLTGDAVTYVGASVIPSDTSAKRLVLVGIEAVDEFSPPGKGGSGRMAWATMGTAHSRDEYLGINCLAMAWAGNQDEVSRRNETFALFQAVVAAMQADPSIGRPGGALYITDYTWDYSPISGDFGLGGQIAFTLNFRARI